MFLPAPSDRRHDFPAWPTVIVAVVEALPLLLLILVLSPALLIGSLLPGRQRFTLRLLAAVKQWHHRLPRP